MDLAPKTVIRPIKRKDIDALCEMARESGVGFTSLPENREFLAKKIALSEESFAKKDQDLFAENYLFVAKDVASGRIIGTSAVAANVGADELFYTYKLGKLTKACSKLGIRLQHETLSLTTDYQGAAEVCTLFVLPEFRTHKAGQLLSRSRFLFMSEFPGRFSDIVLAEMRGVSDDNGFSPFWNAIGRKFFGGVKFPQADYLTGMGEKQFIADLMPEFRLYVCMLPDDAKAAIGEVHEKTRPALKLLQRENFHYRGYVDIFDAGPTVEARLETIRTVKKNKRADVVGFSNNVGGRKYIITNTSCKFRACIGCLTKHEDGSVSLPRAVAKELKIKKHDAVRFIAVA